MALQKQITGETSQIYVNTPKNLYDVENKKTQKPTESEEKLRGGNYHSGSPNPVVVPPMFSKFVMQNLKKLYKMILNFKNIKYYFA
ncbi:hypothetical protein BU593_11780 [Staphylococcus arlettae]|nr:hypothetical protein BU593_11780 [Staphylococcus arlettae]